MWRAMCGVCVCVCVRFSLRCLLVVFSASLPLLPGVDDGTWDRGQRMSVH